MKRFLAASLFAAVTMPTYAHRLDEYLQSTIISVEKDWIQARMTLTPGVSVSPFLIASIDTDIDGVLSQAEQRAYAEQVLHDLTIGIDGRHLTPRMLSIRFPRVDDMKHGLGEIQIDFMVDLPHRGRERSLTFENHHQSRISAYQVNCLVPRDAEIRIEAQERNYSQSLYRLQYMQTDVRSDLTSVALWSGGIGWFGVLAILLFKRVRLFWHLGG